MLHHQEVFPLLFWILAGDGNHHLVALLAQDGLRLIDESHIEGGDDFGDDDADVVSALLPQVHGQLVAMIPHSVGGFHDLLQGLRLHVPRISRKGAGDRGLGDTQLPCYIHDGDVFCHSACVSW